MLATAAWAQTTTWQSQDVGAVARAGFAHDAGASVSVSGSGADIWENADEFHFRFRSLVGDGEISARLISQRNTNAWAKAGLMIRETVGAGARNAFVALTPSHATAFQARATAGGSTTHTAGVNRGPSVWLRLVRAGDTFTGYESTDGSTWRQIGTASIPGLPQTTLVGLAVTSHADGVLSDGAFDTIIVRSSASTSPPSAPTSLAATPLEPTRVALDWVDNSSNETAFEIERATGSSTSFVRVGSVNANFRQFVDTTTAGATTYHYRVRAINDATASSYSNVATATTPAMTNLLYPDRFVVAPVSSTRADLSWENNTTGAVSLEIDRSLDGVAYSRVATVPNTVSYYRDNGLSPATRYFYRIRAVSGQSTSAYNSREIRTFSQTSVWNSQMLGWHDSRYEGYASPSASQITVAGSGSDIWGAEDAFRFYYQSWSGDGEIVVRINSQTNTHSWAKAGVMFRERMTSDSPYALMAATPGWGTVYQYRTAVRREAQSGPESGTAPLPRWLKIVRQGNVFTGFDSVDGASWTNRGSATLNVGAEVFVGLAVCSHNSTVVSTATFDNLAVRSGPGTPTLAAPTSIRATGLSETSFQVSWADNTADETGFEVHRSSDNTSFVRIATVAADATRFVDTGLQAASHYYYRVRAVKGTLMSDFSDVAIGQTGGTGVNAPTGAAVQNWTSRNDVTWNDTSLNEFGFSIERSFDGVNFSVIGTVGANVRVFSDQDISFTSRRMTYYYRVRAFNGSLFSAYSNVASVEFGPGGPGFAPFAIGGATPIGGASHDAGVWTVSGAGTDIWETADSFLFEAQSLLGECEIVVRVTHLDPTHPWAKAGIMFRDSIAAGAKNAFLALTSGNGVAWQTRTTAGGTTSFTAGGAGAAPVWLKLTRFGNTFEAFRSADGATWSSIGSATIEMPQKILVGFAVTSHVNGTLATARFDNLYIGAIRGAFTSPPAAPTNLTAQATSPTQVDLRWTNQANNAEGIQIERSTDNVNFTLLNWPGPNVVAYRDSSAAEDTLYYYRVRAINRVGPSAWITASVRTPSFSSTPVEAPSGLVATAISDSQIDLRWTDNSASETGFSVERSTDGVTFAPVQTLGANGIGVSDTGLAASTTYHYRVRAVRGTTNSAYSNPASATTRAAGMRTWFQADIGAVGVPGSNDTGTASMTIRGSGTDIWDRADSFRFVYQVIQGDCIIEAQVSSLSNTHPWAKAGVMIRDNGSPGARNIYAMVTPGNGVFAQARTSEGGESAIIAGSWGTPPPYWVQLRRAGSTIAASISADGNTWQPLTTVNLPLGTEVLVGFAVTSHDNSVSSTAVFNEPIILTPPAPASGAQ